MKNRFTLFFAALMMTLGVCAQETTLTPEQIEAEGASKGYYTFEANVTGMNKLTSVDQFMTTDEQGNSVGKQIMIQHCHEGTEHEGHEGFWLTIYSLSTNNTHKVYMQGNPVGVGIYTPVKVDNEGTFNLQTSHMRLVENTTCYLTKYNDQTHAISTSADSRYFGNYKFVPAGDGKWKIEFPNFNSAGSAFLWVDTQDEEEPDLGVYQIQTGLTGTNLEEQNRKISLGYFYVYEVTETQGEVKYVKDATVNLIGQGGNTITGTHTGWSDFYEFVMSGDAYGCTLLNYHYDDATNTITSNIEFPFSITGDYVQVPVYLHANANTNKRVAVVDGVLKVIDNEEGDANPNSQWYIRPRIEGLKITYALQNVGTGKYIYFTPTSSTISLNDGPAYFNLEKYANLPSGASEDAVRFTFTYKANNYSYSYCLYNSSWGFTSGQTSNNYPGYNFLVSTVPSDNTDIGFIQKYPAGTSFWNKGNVNINDATQCPTAVKSMLEAQEHEFRDYTHKIYCASTAIKVNSRSDVSVTFTYDGGGHLLNIFGVDIVHLDGTAFLFDYHQGTAGTSPNKNTYTLKNVPAGEYRIRYFVCNTPELNGDQGHNLNKNAGTITVTGANLRLKSSDTPNGDWATNTNWYTINQGLCTGNRICAEPAYTDWSNNLTLNNDNVAMNSAALWCFVGNDTDGYTIYNRAWGTDYALATIGDDDKARTMMKPVAEASTYDVVFHAYNGGKGQFFIRTHGSENDFLNDRGDYLAKWNTAYAYEANGSVMMINEVLDTEVFDEGLPPVVENLKKGWALWTDNPTISEVYEDMNNSSFTSWVLERQQLAKLLDGKVFKFVSSVTNDQDSRIGRILGINNNGASVGLDKETKSLFGYIQLSHNGDGSFKLYHPATGKSFGTPGSVTGNTTDAANYTFKMPNNQDILGVAFVTGYQMIHLHNNDHGYAAKHYYDLNDAASFWTAAYNADAQELAEILARARAEQARVTTDGYKTNYPGFATEDAIDNLTTEISNTPERIESDFKTAITELKKKISNLLSPGFFTFKYTNDLYLNDDRKNQSETQRTLKEKDEVKSLFYYNDKKTLVGYASGNGFLYGVCNATSIKTAAEYNTFTFEPSTQEVEKFFVKSGSGESLNDIYANDYYFKVNQNCIDRTNNPSEYATWTIEPVTSLSVKFNDGKDGYAYSTLYSPVALTISNNIEAFTGTVQGQSLILNQLEGTIPAGVGVILRTAAGPGTYTLDITTETQGDTGDLVGDVFTQKNEGATYYSLNMVDDKVAFYKYTGNNLNGFRARLKFNNSNVKQLNFSFNNTTDIEEVISAFQHNAVYDLCGRRVTTPTKGLYIINGKKVFIK